MRIKVFLLFFDIIVALAIGYLFYPAEYNGQITKHDETLVFAHRGFGNHAPDNSLVASQIAVIKGLDGADVDGQLTSDGKLVIFHDLSVDRLTDGKGSVKDKTLDEMLRLDLAPKYKGEKKFKTAPVKTFEDFVREITPHSTLMVELKTSKTGDTGIEKEAVRIIEKYNAWDKVILSSFNPLVIWRLEHTSPRIKTMFNFMDTNWNEELLKEIKPEDQVDLPWFLRNNLTRTAVINAIKPDALSINDEVNEKTIDTMKRRGFPVFIWPVNTTEKINWALEKKPYGIISDEPDLAKKLRDEKQE